MFGVIRARSCAQQHWHYVPPASKWVQPGASNILGLGVFHQMMALQDQGEDAKMPYLLDPVNERNNLLRQLTLSDIRAIKTSADTLHRSMEVFDQQHGVA